MGQGHSRAADEEADFFLQSGGGVRVTQGLLEQLAGRPRAAAVPPQQPGGATSQALRPTLPLAAAQQAQQLAAADRQLAASLERSRRVGGLLLKHEAEELQRINQLADELVAREFAAPRRPRPCQQQADDCVRCYAENAGEPLACAAAVEAYSACAKQAWQEAIERAAL